MQAQDIQTVRRFSRTVSQRAGLLDANYLGTGRPLAEARLLFEIGQHGCTVRELRQRLGFDPGYLSRLLRALEKDGLVKNSPDESDARVRRVRLSPAGLTEWQSLDKRSDHLAQSLIAPLPDHQRERLLQAMSEVERFLRASALKVEIAHPDSPEARACIDAYFSELRQRFENGFNPEITTSAKSEELTPPAGYFLLAWLDGETVGCVALKVHERIGEIKRMWVAPSARGLGLAHRILQATGELARQAGLQKIQLDTNRSLGEARLLYLKNGYTEIPAYNDNPYAHYWFEKSL
ncbi:bifunctional helix-turn-helix transcriptional regulator/GNAT family N-acetyltransferase [Alcaligenes faecalis]|uniref:bifunctional helix-turn-helix transcriptional regulator/GNAT family N-acetyltransferase n=1 Tax=Alcaligenes faecalis TaxID=511 RepID=UPI001C83B4F0|nr:bifunctional helix-turn-helix transcriptional regulator/GNAT family N-acetyltransferase [Alcaligenes faecalis]MBX6965479.1 MarR family transcriptional regulator [Providencia rettgeri]MBX7030818.1 MarR family transcriptional regulator [Alcaligenes faecalis]